jgi:hypothetical protein
MQPDPYGAWPQTSDLGYFIIRQPFHIPQDENNAVLGRQSLNGFS